MNKKCSCIGCEKEATEKIKYEISKGNYIEMDVCSDHQDINQNILLQGKEVI